MRIISGKIVLAARIDLSKSNPNGELGETYKQEILTKIDKLLTPPQQSIDKSLPKPIEMKSKREQEENIKNYEQNLKCQN